MVIACGVWSPRIARMAGATIPLTPAVHQMIDVGPIPILQESGKELAFPIVRDMDTFMYERQTSGSMEVGSYAHRPIFHSPDEIPSIAEARLSPTELPFTADDFDDQLEDALELMPEILSGAEIKYAVNGLLSLTPDAMPLIGETVEVRNLWSAAAIWIKEGPGTGRAVAEWMTNGYPELDPHASDIARFYPYARTEHHVRARCAEHFNKTYGIVHPREQWASERDKRLSPVHSRTGDLGAVYFEAGGWERPHWYESNAPLVDHYGIEDRPHEWDRRWWSPIQNAEHLAMREKVGLVDLAPFVIFDFTGPGVVDYIQHMTVNNADVEVGRSVYTPLLTESGGFKADLTVLRLGDEHFRVITGAFDGPRDKHWFRRHLPEDGSVHMADFTSAYTTIGVWGPEARNLVQSITDHDLSNEAFPYGTTQAVDFGSINARLFRISYVGELGWEVYVPTEAGRPMWDRLWEAGQDLGVVAVGAGVYGTTGRLEKGYRLMGAELESEYNPVEAGLARPRVKEHDFIGKEAYLAAREEEPAAILCTLTVEDHVSPRDGIKRYPTGREPITTPRRRADHRPQGPALVCDHRRRRALGRQVSVDGLSAAGACGGGQRPGGDVHERALSGEGGGGRLDAALRPRRPADEELRILVCVKRVPAPGARIVLTDDQQAIDARHLPFTVSPHEECAVEEAVRIKEKHDGSVVVMTLGPAEAEEQLRYAVSVGADEAVLLATDGSDWDPQATAAALAAKTASWKPVVDGSTSSSSATSPPTPAATRSGSEWPMPWAGR